MRRKVLFAVGSVLVIAMLAAVGFIGPRNIVGMLRYDARRDGDFKAGDRAPDVELVALDGARTHLKERFGDKPMVLIFGSFT